MIQLSKIGPGDVYLMMMNREDCTEIADYINGSNLDFSEIVFCKCEGILSDDMWFS